jgi:hypothetical protein
MANIQVHIHHRTVHEGRRSAAFCICKFIYFSLSSPFRALHPYLSISLFHAHIYICISAFALRFLALVSQGLRVEASSRAESAFRTIFVRFGKLHAANHTLQLSAAIGFNGVDHLQGHGCANGPARASLQPVVQGELGGGRGDWGGNEVTSSGPLQRLLFPAAGSKGVQCSSAIGATLTLRLTSCKINTIT